jgi:hypothetical protein
MTPQAGKPATPPNLAELTMRYMNRPVDAAEIAIEAGALGEVEPHEVAVGFRADPRLAWREGLAVAAMYGLKEELNTVASPSEWAGVVVRDEPVAAQPFALAGYPQRVRDLTSLLQATDLTKLLPTGASRPAAPALRSWAAKQLAQGNTAHALVAAAILRAASDFDQAETILNDIRSRVPAAQVNAFRNEEAALNWQKGLCDKAATIWNELPESPAVMFNRGMAALFARQFTRARDCFKKAIAALPENIGWHHLASLYLALAEMRA